MTEQNWQPQFNAQARAALGKIAGMSAKRYMVRDDPNLMLDVRDDYHVTLVQIKNPLDPAEKRGEIHTKFGYLHKWDGDDHGDGEVVLQMFEMNADQEITTEKTWSGAIGMDECYYRNVYFRMHCRDDLDNLSDFLRGELADLLTIFLHAKKGVTLPQHLPEHETDKTVVLYHITGIPADIRGGICGMSEFVSLDEWHGKVTEVHYDENTA